MHLDLINIIFLIAATLVSLSYFFTDILLLRLLSILGAVGYLFGGSIAGLDKPGMLTIVLFSLINFAINAIQSIRIVLARIPIFLPNELKDIYTKTFDIMTPNEFLRIYKLSKTASVKQGEQITIQDKPVESLILLKEGRTDIIEDKQIITSLSAGFFVGEMSFLTGQMANATVTVASDTVDYLVWDKKKLDQLKIKDPDLYEKLEHTISINLIRKISKQVHRAKGVPLPSS
ncbi:Cyclic nucleotide-binding domain protein [Legionella nautarum]|uniref:Cyclic nucleotide-binding domain protein n=1 Tax=Legionella nautarum TaxID=45070 RepID=A0A0W0WL31_9GAMM|nr:cyclic nucleotide-binding domain-containing protein [Legionella nautarum]KTD33040.1 Cyclic nucleotide-binding domain protein [Legionella nautarum]